MSKRRITPQTTLDNLKKEAKRWLKALRANDAEAIARLKRVHPKAPASPGLRDVQHAIALEYEFSGWSKLKEALGDHAGGNSAADDLAAKFLEYACPDHHVRGRPAHMIARNAAMRMLRKHPEIASANLYTAIVCGEIEEVERILAENPAAACEKSIGSAARSGVGETGDIYKDLGRKSWEPLLYACFTRLPLDKSSDNAVAIVRLLLDHGADPNVYFMAGDSRYTPLVGVIGEGEENRPPHPQRDELTRLLLERGAAPYDIQVVYNIHFHGKILWFMKLMYEFSVKAGKQADWDDPEWRMLDMGGYGSGARWHLAIAVDHNDLELAEWCLSHGANPNSPPPGAKTLPQYSLYERALRSGYSEMAELLVRYGAKTEGISLVGENAFVAACLRMDRAEVTRQIREHPEYLQSAKAMIQAAEQDRVDVVEMLLGFGVPIEIENAEKQRPLHAAAWSNSIHVAQFLIERGAHIDAVENNWGNTPLDFAIWGAHTQMIELLSRYSKDIGSLAFTGNLARIREVLADQPELAKLNGGSTPLFSLPDDEVTAAQIVDLLIGLGADASFRRKDGLTAADVARRRGLDEAAAKLAKAAAHPSPPEVQRYESLARDLVFAYDTGDAAALDRLNRHYKRSFTWEDLRAQIIREVYTVRQNKARKGALDIGEARLHMARGAGFNNWDAFMESVVKGTPPPGEPYAIDRTNKRIEPRRNLTPSEWDVLIGVMKEQRIPSFNANGLATDDVMARIAQLDHVTYLELGGSRGLSDDGLLHLAHMPQLQHLNLSESPGGKLTDRGLEVLRHLPNLRIFEMSWQAAVSDAGVANLKFCDQIEKVHLLGSPTGDGAIRALVGKPNLYHFDTGRLVTDAGIPLLHEFPLFKTRSHDSNRLLIDGPFTDEGLKNLAGLEGLLGLHFFWHVVNMTTEGLKVLTALPNLEMLGCEGELCDDTAMRYIARMPKLIRLQAQGTVATDDGFESLSKSQTIENIWGRECPNLKSRGFVALANMPKLKDLGVSCKFVDDGALATLPLFPSLIKFMPMDVPDAGFRHVGCCENLEFLSCMYCRDTTDVATEHVAGLSKLKQYYAGKTQITDRSLEILGSIPSLERAEFWEVTKITDAGLPFLAALPNLREIEFGKCPGVSLAGTAAFRKNVNVIYR